MKKLSAVIITKNEEQNIERCLKSIADVADEILIIDAESNDRTEQIARSFKNVVFINHPWEGYARSKNFGNSQAQYEWILSIDADEALSSQLQMSILKAKEKDQGNAYRFARLTNYCGVWIRHCNWYPDYKVRLFNRNSAEWTGDSIHEKLVLKKEVKILNLAGDCFHFSINSIDDHFVKANAYSTIWAKDAFKKGKKANYLLLIFKPIISFITTYL